MCQEILMHNKDKNSKKNFAFFVVKQQWQLDTETPIEKIPAIFNRLNTQIQFGLDVN